MPKSELPERDKILEEWDRWAKDSEGRKADGIRALAFYGYLANEKQRLLEFNFAGDKWQMVKIWLRQAGKISD
jgi:hypothetical protein